MIRLTSWHCWDILSLFTWEKNISKLRGNAWKPRQTATPFLFFIYLFLIPLKVMADFNTSLNPFLFLHREIFPKLL